MGYTAISSILNMLRVCDRRNTFLHGDGYKQSDVKWNQHIHTMDGWRDGIKMWYKPN